jgi:peptidoglycan/xylan/chitin deacetylase (PgdA/CDA1 family)
VKTYKYLFRGGIYLVVLIGAIWGLSFSMFNEDKQSKPAVNVEVNQELGSKIINSNVQAIEDKKVSNGGAPAEKKVLRPSESNNLDSTNGVAILMYHYTTEKSENYMSVPKEKFSEQMKYLKQNGYNVISLDELYSHYTEGSTIPDKAVVITFDDGYKNNYLYAYPILKEHGFKATIFMITSKIGEYLYLTVDDIKELDKGGVGIECHTVNHLQLGQLSYDRQLYELTKSKMELEKILGRDLKYVSYPYGDFNEDTMVIVNDLKFRMGMGTFSAKAKKSNGFYAQNRIAVSGSLDIEQFKALLNKK